MITSLKNQNDVIVDASIFTHVSGHKSRVSCGTPGPNQIFG